MAKHTSTKEKKGFLRSVLPWKGDSPKLVINKLLCLVALTVFLVCGWILLDELVIQPTLTRGENNEITGMYYGDSSAPPASSAASSTQSSEESSAPEPEEPEEPERDAQGRLIKFTKLLGVNDDIVGWIKVPGTLVDLPVLQGKDNDYYLYHNYKKQATKAASIFLDYRNKLDDKCQIIFGHSLNSGLMFTTLNRYKKLDFYKQNPVFTYDTLQENGQWKIISVFLTNTREEHGEPFNYMRTSFRDDSDYLNFVYQMRIRSIYNTGVSFNADDDIVLLSTCSYEFKEFREVVVARRVRPGESEEVDVSKATQNKKVLYPDIWYQKKGGTKPNWPATYEGAKEKNLLTWSEN